MIGSYSSSMPPSKRREESPSSGSGTPRIGLDNGRVQPADRSKNLKSVSLDAVAGHKRHPSGPREPDVRGHGMDGAGHHGLIQQTLSEYHQALWKRQQEEEAK